MELPPQLPPTESQPEQVPLQEVAPISASEPVVAQPAPFSTEQAPTIPEAVPVTPPNTPTTPIMGNEQDLLKTRGPQSDEQLTQEAQQLRALRSQ